MTIVHVNINFYLESVRTQGISQIISQQKNRLPFRAAFSQRVYLIYLVCNLHYN
jgi:hypothetical protein